MGRLPFFKCGDRGDLVLGRTGASCLAPRYRIPGHARSKHTHVIGKTGKGKSKTLEHMICQDIAAGEGAVILLDPHSDLITAVLQNCLSTGTLSRSAEDVGRVVYFAPARQDYVLPFNVLAGAGRPHEIAGRIIEAMRRAWPRSLGEASVFTQVASSSLITLIENRLTFVDLPRLLTDKAWRDQLLEQVTNEPVVTFFRSVYDAWGRDQVKLIGSTLNKVTQFSFNPDLRLILAQPENRLDFRKIIDEGKVVLMDIGQLEGDDQRLMGTLILTALEQAAMSRRDTPPDERRPAYCYIDEFQDFVSNNAEGSSKTLAKILSECRKYGLYLTLAHQNMSQIEGRMEGALSNIATRIVFGVGGKDAQYFADEMGALNTQAIKHAPLTETQYPLYRTLLEQLHDWKRQIKNQPARQAYVEGHDGEVTKIWLAKIPPYTANAEQARAFCRASAQAQGIPYAQAWQNLCNGMNDSRSPNQPAIPAYDTITDKGP
jgi:hypothetical protein